MRQKTVETLDALAAAAVENLRAEAALGFTSPALVEAARARTKNPTAAEVVKTMIRSDVKSARALLDEDAETPLVHFMTNVMKTTEQFNYLANSIDARLKRRAKNDETVRSLYAAMTGKKKAEKTA